MSGLYQAKAHDKTHRMGMASPLASNHQSHHSSSSKASQWQSQTTPNGKLLIAKKNNSQPNKKEYSSMKLEKTIWRYLTELKEDAAIADIDRFTGKIMKAIRNCGFVQQSSSSGASGISKSSPSSGEHKRNDSSKSLSSKLKKPKKEKSPQAIAVLNRVVDNAKRTGKKVPNELLCLLPSDGYVTPTCTRTKRVPKPVMRFSETQFESISKRRQSTYRSENDDSTLEPVMKKRVRTEVTETVTKKTLVSSVLNSSVLNPIVTQKFAQTLDLPLPRPISNSPNEEYQIKRQRPEIERVITPSWNKTVSTQGKSQLQYLYNCFHCFCETYVFSINFSSSFQQHFKHASSR